MLRFRGIIMQMFKKTAILKSPYDKGKQKEKYLMVFLCAFFGMMVAFLPSMIVNKGIFLYYGDFNSQQMMFYQHANEAVREGATAWDWGYRPRLEFYRLIFVLPAGKSVLLAFNSFFRLKQCLI